MARGREDNPGAPKDVYVELGFCVWIIYLFFYLLSIREYLRKRLYKEVHNKTNKQTIYEESKSGMEKGTAWLELIGAFKRAND